MSEMKIYVKRFLPNEDLKQSLMNFAIENQIKAGFIITCVGSLRTAHLRFAGAQQFGHFDKKMEIVSLVGTISVNGAHLHISLSDEKGEVVGGHLVDGCWINVTAEVVIGEALNYHFDRTLDPNTGYKELLVTKL